MAGLWQQRLQLRAGLLPSLVWVRKHHDAACLGSCILEALQDMRLQVAAGAIEAEDLHTHTGVTQVAEHNLETQSRSGGLAPCRDQLAVRLLDRQALQRSRVSPLSLGLAVLQAAPGWAGLEPSELASQVQAQSRALLVLRY